MTGSVALPEAIRKQIASAEDAASLIAIASSATGRLDFQQIASLIAALESHPLKDAEGIPLLIRSLRPVAR